MNLILPVHYITLCPRYLVTAGVIDRVQTFFMTALFQTQEHALAKSECENLFIISSDFVRHVQY